MKKLKRLNRSRLWVLFGSSVFFLSPAWAGISQGGPYLLSKMFMGGSGAVFLQRDALTLSGSAGEVASGHRSGNSRHELTSGYLGGYLGRGPGLRVLRTQVGTPSFYQDGIQVGVPLNATLEVVFSDQLNPGTLSGIQILRILDHLGQRDHTLTSTQFHYEPETATVYVTAQEGWSGNSLYEILITSELQSIDGFTVSESFPVRFMSAVDPHQNNRVMSPITASLTQALQGVGMDPIEIKIPAQALPDYSVALVSRNPLQQPLSIDPALIREANQKASQTWGRYGTPIAVREINLVDLQGRRWGALAKSVAFSMRMEEGALPPESLARKKALAIWALDEEHRLWVKLPESQLESDQRTLTAPVARFSVFAFMAAPLGNASDVTVFPNPWRPHGPAAGNAAGQTGTEEGGITFNQLPSECTIRIFTLNGELVRELRHSDLSGRLGQTVWDGKTQRSDKVASGVYLWRVESEQDGKSGKLMVIR